MKLTEPERVLLLDLVNQMQNGGFDVSSIKAKLVERREVGALGLTYSQAGGVVQELASVIVDREEHTEEEVIAALLSPSFDQEAWWQAHGGPAVDSITEWLFPDEEENLS